MSRTKSSGPLHYEMLYIIPNQYTEEELPPVYEKVEAAIAGGGGAITGKNPWGKKRLAYPIKNNRHGYYALLEFNAERDRLSEITRVLRMMNEVLRFQIVVKKVKTAAEIERDKIIADKIAAKAAQTKEKEKEKEKEAKKEKPKVDLKDLDEKLDKILEADDLL